MDDQALSALLDHAIESSALKDVERSGWILRGVDHPESVADHSWGTAHLCLLFAQIARTEPSMHDLDPYRALSMALVHDLAEVRVGDIPRRVGQDPAEIEAKAELEFAAILSMTAIPDDADGEVGIAMHLIRDLWRDYEASESPAARFVRDMNLVDMCLQALAYERDERYVDSDAAVSFPDYPRMAEFFETSRSRCTTAVGKALHRLAEERYRRILHSRNQ